MNELLLRSTVFAAVFLAMLAAESLAPRRCLLWPWWRRGVTNLALGAIDSLALRLLVPLGAVGTAAWTAQAKCGLLHHLEAPPWIEGLAAFVALECLIYWQHRAFHRVPALWRLHSVHHSDPDLDTTTALRFHPLEILLSMGIKMAAVVLLGPPVAAVVAFEIALNSGALFNHGNLALPRWLDRILRWVVVTPDMHSIHHSAWPPETDSNFGFFLSFWDRLFGTYRDRPRADYTSIQIGLEEVPAVQALGLLDTLRLPWTRRVGGATR